MQQKRENTQLTSKRSGELLFWDIRTYREMNHYLIFPILWRNFRLSVKSNWFFLSLLCDWSKKLAPLSQPLRCKTNTNHDLFARISCALGSLVVFILSSLIGSSGYFPFFSLAVEITLVQVLWHSVKKHSKDKVRLNRLSFQANI